MFVTCSNEGLLLSMLCCPWPVSLIHKKRRRKIESRCVSGTFVHLPRKRFSHYVIVRFGAASGTVVSVRRVAHCADRFLLLKITQQENQPSFSMLRCLLLHSTPFHDNTFRCNAMFLARPRKDILSN
ncbi:hypothetical protein E2C01_049947 [Portunus trituberculatus]|uniref:Uncharacterized protein n=1 Tax=Portunus trituberculatus TaxID=210409 RepID=A0A5B7GFY0_PORTR|nr:hypothetical protein [Portunus trituberculatus]